MSMTPSPRAVEAAARAAYHATPRNKPYDVLTLNKKNLYRAEAQAAITAYLAALAVDGVALVPRADLQRVVDIAGRNEAAPEIDAVRAHARRRI